MLRSFLGAMLLLSAAAASAQPALVAPRALATTALDLDLVWDSAHPMDVVQLATARTLAPGTRLTLAGGGAAPAGRFEIRHHATALSNHTVYYWRVVRGGLVSAVDSFRTVVAAVAPGADYPSANLEVASTRFAFAWNLGTGGTGYHIRMQVREASAPSDWSVTVIDTVGGDLKRYATRTGQLRDSTQYVWRVVAYVSGGPYTPSQGASLLGLPSSYRSVGYSLDVPFSTRPLLVDPAPIWPTGTDVMPSTAFTWSVTAPADGLTYSLEQIDLTLGEAFTGGPSVSGIATRTYTFPTALVEGHRYRWRVRACVGATARCTAWSAPLTFTVREPAAPATPEANWPTGGVTVYGASAGLSWFSSGAPAGQQYVVYTRLCDTPACSDAPAPSLAGTGYTASALQTGTTLLVALLPGRGYAWYVRALNADGSPGAASARARFRSYNPPAAVAVPTYPAGNPDLYTNLPTLAWTVEGLHAGGFEVRWGVSNNPEAATASATAAAGSTFYTPTAPLAWGTRYYWHVRPSGSARWRSASFTTVGQPGTLRPVRTVPTNDAVLAGPTATLGWYLDGAAMAVARVEVQVSTRGAFTDGFTTTTPLGASARSFTTGALVAGTTYYWRVRAFNGTAFSPWSTRGRFTLAPGAGTVVPLAASPTDFDEAEAMPTLSWALPAMSLAALAYDVEVAANAAMQDAVRATVGEAALALTTPRAPGTYYWRVRSRTAEGAVSAFSDVAAFIVYPAEGATAHEPSPVLPVLALSAPRPHPVRDGATMAFALPEAAPVTLALYDLTGRLVRTLVQGERPAGPHTAAWDGTAHDGTAAASGVYVLRLHTPIGSHTRPVVVLR